MLSPVLDGDLCLLQGVEDFAIEQFITELRVEALAIAIFPRTAVHDLGGPGTDSRDPFAEAWQCIRAIVGSKCAWIAFAIDLPCALKTSTCRSFVTISSAVCLFLGILKIPIGSKAISQGGSLFRGQTNFCDRATFAPIVAAVHRP